jgi:hypothetical protein
LIGFQTLRRESFIAVRGLDHAGALFLVFFFIFF